MGELRLVDPTTNKEYVAVAAAAFEQVKRILAWIPTVPLGTKDLPLAVGRGAKVTISRSLYTIAERQPNWKWRRRPSQGIRMSVFSKPAASSSGL